MDKNLKPYWGSEPEHLEEKKPLDDVFLSWVWSLTKRFFKSFFKKWEENEKLVNFSIGYFFFFLFITGIARMIIIESKYGLLGCLVGLWVLAYFHSIWMKEVIIKMHVEEHGRELQKKVIELEQKLENHDAYLAMKKERK